MSDKRKNWKDHQDDYRNALLKVSLLEARIQKRALELCMAFPSVCVDQEGKNLITAGMFYDEIKSKKYTASPETCLDVIKKIEQHIADQHPHQQGDLFPAHKTSKNAVRIANPETKDKRYV